MNPNYDIIIAEIKKRENEKPSFFGIISLDIIYRDGVVCRIDVTEKEQIKVK